MGVATLNKFKHLVVPLEFFISDVSSLIRYYKHFAGITTKCKVLYFTSNDHILFKVFAIFYLVSCLEVISVLSIYNLLDRQWRNCLGLAFKMNH